MNQSKNIPCLQTTTMHSLVHSTDFHIRSLHCGEIGRNVLFELQCFCSMKQLYFSKYAIQFQTNININTSSTHILVLHQSDHSI
uniref:Uncharacterized protein n=1 Tax=Anguilla anguilla TaxID=7936 RepID=A0A0E9WVU6_ANGAN